MNSADYVKTLFEESISVKQQALTILQDAIATAAQSMVQCLRLGGIIFSCGNGGSAADAQHFSSKLINRFETNRRGLAAIALSTDTSTLTSIANDRSFEEVFARQIQALGRKGDILPAISTSGQSANVNRAILAAQQQSIDVIALSGKDGGDLAPSLSTGDIELRVPATSIARIQEVHLLIIHCLCGLIESNFSDA